MYLRYFKIGAIEMHVLPLSILAKCISQNEQALFFSHLLIFLPEEVVLQFGNFICSPELPK
jgi:hypothetical protein